MGRNSFALVHDLATLAGYSARGGRPEDQDCLGCDVVNGAVVLTVCDGMGGHAGGCVASETAVQSIVQTYGRLAATLSVPEAIKAALTEANSAIFTRSQAEPSLRGMGTTVTMLVVDAKAAYVTHVGDSRVYQLRGGKKIFRTFDDSMVFEQVAKGKMTEEEARQHPRSNVLSKALGVIPDVEVRVNKLSYRKGDRFVLCCDGVWNTQPEPDIIKMLSQQPTPAETTELVHTTVDNLGLAEGGPYDNHTIIVADMLKPSAYRKTLVRKIAAFFARKKS